jgi:hypothetical protein
VTVKLNAAAFGHAKTLIKKRHYVLDDRDAWSEHQPSTAQRNEFLREHGFAFPYGDFVDVHRCGVLAAESRAGQRKYTDIEIAIAHLHGMLEAVE